MHNLRCRVETADNLNGGAYSGDLREKAETWQSSDRAGGQGSGFRPGVGEFQQPAGRWPPNMLLAHAPDCGAVCATGCPVAVLNEQSGVTKSTEGKVSGANALGQNSGWNGHNNRPMRINRPADAGGASRFFPTFTWEEADFFPFYYCAKASGKEREVGLTGEGKRANIHPTVKPIALMRWLCRLVGGKPGSIILDPFMGSGTTGIAARAEGFRFMGIERDPAYMEIARARIAHWQKKV